MNTLPLCASILASLALSATGGETTPAKDDCCKRNWITGEGVSLGGVLFPEINYQTAFGTASTDPARLAIGHHDPDRKGFTQQNIEFSLGARLGENVRLFSTYNTKIDLDDHWDDDIEEYYAVFSGLSAYRDAGSFTIYAGCSNEAVGEVIDLCVEELRGVKSAPVPDAELQRSKDHLKGSLMLSLENTASRMSHLARQEIYFDRQFGLDETLHGIERVTREDVQRVAADLFTNGSLAATVLGNVNGLQIPVERLDLD